MSKNAARTHRQLHALLCGFSLIRSIIQSAENIMAAVARQPKTIVIINSRIPNVMVMVFRVESKAPAPK